MTSKPLIGRTDGVLVVNKPKGPTSAGCVALIKQALGVKKIGHAGTLDPMATGVLVILVGKGTKIAPFVSGGEKIYKGELRLGLTTDTYDIEGKVTGEADWQGVSPKDVKQAVAAWQELQTQEVPPISAAKHRGKPLYKLSRAGRQTPVKTKQIRVHRAQVLDIDLPRVEFRVNVGAGTYVRSLVHSLGQRLGVGAVLTALTREKSGPFTIDEALDLDRVTDEPGRFPDRMISIPEALHGWPRAILTPDQVQKVRNGARLGSEEIQDLEPEPGDMALFLEPDGRAAAIVRAELKNGTLLWSIVRGI